MIQMVIEMINAYVDVLTLITSEGVKIPRQIIWEDGRIFKIDSYKQCGMVLSLGGKCGILYKVRIRGKDKKLYYDPNTNKWFIDIG